MQNLIIPDSVYPYLRVQKGEINHIEDREEFEAVYNKGLQELFDLILPHIPAKIGNSLDIGSGMGGIDILLQKHFKHEVTLLDAVHTPPLCTKHDTPFNSLKTCEDFFKTNNCPLEIKGGLDLNWKERDRYFNYIDSELRYHINGFTNRNAGGKIDFIFSVGSYCFHYSPLVYLDFVKAMCHQDTVLIFDVRNRHTDWLEILRENFTEVAVLVESDKFTKRVFKIK